MMNHTSFKRALCAAGLLIACATPTLALAGTSGGIAGIVTDSKTGVPISGVRLQISSPSQTITVTTDAHGRYIAFALQPDNYTLTASKDGYTVESTSGYPVFADQTQQYDLKLDETSGS
jgi:large repetitive protein